MASVLKNLTTLRFEGPMFEDHCLEVNSLSELIAYKKILLETAKELWRANNPERERLPKGFEDSIRIKFRELGKGSTAVPLLREVVYPDGELPFMVEDELDRAAEIIEETVEAAGNNNALPMDLPKRVVPLFESFGKSLNREDSIFLKSPRRSHEVQYSIPVRENLLERIEDKYHDNVDIIGEVRAADIDGYNFTLRLDNGTKVPGKFEPEQEDTFTNALKEHSFLRLRINGEAEFLHKNGSIHKLVKINSIESLLTDNVEFDSSCRPIWEVVAEIGGQISDEALAEIPSDLSRNLDKYLYISNKDDE